MIILYSLKVNAQSLHRMLDSRLCWMFTGLYINIIWSRFPPFPDRWVSRTVNQRGPQAYSWAPAAGDKWLQITTSMRGGLKHSLLWDNHFNISWLTGRILSGGSSTRHDRDKIQTHPVAPYKKQGLSQLLLLQPYNINPLSQYSLRETSMNTVSLCTIRGEDSCQMTVITLRMNMVLIGIIKLGHVNKCPWSCTMRQMSTWMVMMMMMMGR